MKTLVAEIKQKLGIDGGMYIDAEIESYIQHIDKSKYFEFFKALSGSHEFAKPIDRIANVAKRFENNETSKLLAGVREQAKAMYDKLYAENCAMTDYAQANRDKVPNDRDFFVNMDYSKLKRKDGTPTYTKKELYVLTELGGGSWLCDIRFAQNSNDIVNKIESIIKNAITTKYSGNAIESKRVVKMLGGAK